MKSSSTNFIKRLKKQKEDALEFIIDAYLPLVKTISIKVLGSHHHSDVDECVNDVFLTVWQNASQFTGEPEDFKKWVGTITKYKAIDRYRKSQLLFSREQFDTSLENKQDTETADGILLKKEDRNELLVALCQLESVDRDIFIMKYFMEIPNYEIAESLGLTKAAVDNRLYRGKKALATNTLLKELRI